MLDVFLGQNFRANMTILVQEKSEPWAQVIVSLGECVGSGERVGVRWCVGVGVMCGGRVGGVECGDGVPWVYKDDSENNM